MPRIPQLRRAALALAGAAALAVPALAVADDQSVYDTWHTTHPRFVKLRHDFDRAQRHWEDSGYRDPEPAYRATRKTSKLANAVSDRLKKDSTSSKAGAEARALALRGLNHRRKWADAERRAIQAFMRFDGDGYLRLHDDAKTYIHRAQKFEKQARERFKKAGLGRAF
jgi:hypothetical protein